MVFIEGGNFRMGCTFEQMDFCTEDEKPSYNVNIRSFYLSKYEVTQSQWMAIMGNNPSEFKGCDQCPVENVNWYDVDDFITKLNELTGEKYNLPIEKEWEYAARGNGEGTIYSGSDYINNVAWYENNCTKPQPVGLKLANRYGLYDMSENVWEWTKMHAMSYPGSNANFGGNDLYVIRGGNWFNKANYCRVSYRGNNFIQMRSSGGGFRLAK